MVICEGRRSSFSGGVVWGGGCDVVSPGLATLADVKIWGSTGAEKYKPPMPVYFTSTVTFLFCARNFAAPQDRS